MLVNYYLYHNSVIKFSSIIFKYLNYIRRVEEFNDVYKGNQLYIARAISDFFYSGNSSLEDLAPQYIKYKRN